MRTMRTIILSFALCIAAHAQPRLTFSASGPVAATGQPAVVNINMAGGGMNPAAFQATFALPPGATIAPAASLATVGKQPYGNIANGVATIIIAGGISAIPDGPVATVSFTSTPFQFAPTNMQAVNADAALVAFSGTGLFYGVASLCDVNKDGKVDPVDVRIVADQADGASPCTTGDLNKDGGKCDIVDVQIAAIAAAGGACKAQ